MIKDDEGHLITDETSIVNRFKTHFHTLLNETKEEFIEENEDYLIYYTVQPEILAPNLEEIKNIIKILKNNKTPGEDNINAELIKISTPKIISNIHGIIKDSWENGTIPQEWKTAIICPIYKKGDPMDTKNYRRIALIKKL